MVVMNSGCNLRQYERIIVIALVLSDENQVFGI
jgi:hypothetical protein